MHVELKSKIAILRVGGMSMEERIMIVLTYVLMIALNMRIWGMRMGMGENLMKRIMMEIYFRVIRVGVSRVLMYVLMRLHSLMKYSMGRKRYYTSHDYSLYF
jgi:hypothetical protein